MAVPADLHEAGRQPEGPATWQDSETLSPSSDTWGGEGLEVQLGTNGHERTSRALSWNLREPPTGWGMESFWAGEHVHPPGGRGLVAPSSSGTDTPVFGTLQTCPADLLIRLSVCIRYNILYNRPAYLLSKVSPSLGVVIANITPGVEPRTPIGGHTGQMCGGLGTRRS